MSNYENPYASFGTLAAQAPATERAEFIKKTYIHLAAAIYAFAALEFAYFTLLPVENLMNQFFSIPYASLIMIVGFMGVSWIANSWAINGASRGMQYAGLSLYVVAESLFFLPMLWYAQQFGGEGVIPTAGVITLVMFAGLTAAVLITKKDFSFLRTALMIGGFAAMGLILCAVLFGFDLGVFFTVAMIVLACGYILYYTSNVLHHYRTDQYVAASLALFASVALLFWYVLQMLMSRD